jgi:probable rRNA maturation factor
MKLDIDFSGRFPASLNRDAVRRLVGLTLKRAGWTEPAAAVSIALVTDRQIRRLNKQYRGLDQPTDVLSFEYGGGPAVANQAGQPQQLGEIVISMETLRRQARANRRLVSVELALMVVHGTLHLIGFDHRTPKEETVMFERQQDILMAARLI